MAVANIRKAIVAVSGFAGVVAAVTADGIVDASDAAALIVAAATAVGVYFVPNKIGQ